MSKFLAFALIIISTVVGMGIGYVFTPEYSSKREDEMGAQEKNDKYTDLRYIDHLIAHHKQAIYLAEQAKTKSERKEVQDLAGTIIEVDTDAIDELYGWKKDWYKDSTQVKEYEKINLGEPDEKFDLRFINALIRHHEEGIDGAKEIQTMSSRNEILNLSDTIISSLSEGVITLEGWRYNWYQIGENPDQALYGQANVTDQISLISALQETLGRMSIEGKIKQPFLSVPGTHIKTLDISDTEIQIFEYATVELAQTDLAALKTSKPLWLGTSHIYSSNKIIVIYVGSDAKVLETLNSLLGNEINQ